MCVLWSSFFVVCDHNPGPRLSRICARYLKIEDVNECHVFQTRNLMLSAVESQNHDENHHRLPWFVCSSCCVYALLYV